jgi:hypothetical protein
MFGDIIHEYWAEVSAAAGAIVWFVKLELAHRSKTTKTEQDIREVRLKLDDHDAKIIYMQTEAKTNSIQLTQILVELQAVKTGLEYIKAEMARK